MFQFCVCSSPTCPSKTCQPISDAKSFREIAKFLAEFIPDNFFFLILTSSPFHPQTKVNLELPTSS